MGYPVARTVTSQTPTNSGESGRVAGTDFRESPDSPAHWGSLAKGGPWAGFLELDRDEADSCATIYRAARVGAFAIICGNRW